MFEHCSQTEYLMSSMKIPSSSPFTDGSLQHLHFSPTQAEKLPVNLNIFTATGPDSISDLIFRNGSSTISSRISLLHFQSFSDGLLPSSWKAENTIYILKKGSKSDPPNHSHLPIISQVIEHINDAYLRNYQFSSLSDQFSFCPSYTTIDVYSSSLLLLT